MDLSKYFLKNAYLFQEEVKEQDSITFGKTRAKGFIEFHLNF